VKMETTAMWVLIIIILKLLNVFKFEFILKDYV
jgi:hypothetical protein